MFSGVIQICGQETSLAISVYHIKCVPIALEVAVFVHASLVLSNLMIEHHVYLQNWESVQSKGNPL